MDKHQAELMRKTHAERALIADVVLTFGLYKLLKRGQLHIRNSYFIPTTIGFLFLSYVNNQVFIDHDAIKKLHKYVREN